MKQVYALCEEDPEDQGQSRGESVISAAVVQRT